MPRTHYLRDLPTDVDEAVIVGSGPTKFDYLQLGSVFGPIFFINQAWKVSKYAMLSTQRYFVTHHISQFLDMPDLLTVFIRTMRFEEGADYHGHMHSRFEPYGSYMECDCQADDEVLSEDFFNNHSWLRDPSVCRAFNRSLAGFGSATTAIHLAYLMGAKKLVMIGCDPMSKTDKYDKRFGDGQMKFAPDKVKANNLHLPKLLDMKVNYR